MVVPCPVAASQSRVRWSHCGLRRGAACNPVHCTEGSEGVLPAPVLCVSPSRVPCPHVHHLTHFNDRNLAPSHSNLAPLPYSSSSSLSPSPSAWASPTLSSRPSPGPPSSSASQRTSEEQRRCNRPRGRQVNLPRKQRCGRRYASHHVGARCLDTGRTAHIQASPPASACIADMRPPSIHVQVVVAGGRVHRATAIRRAGPGAEGRAQMRRAAQGPG